MQPRSWINDRLPEMLWAALLTAHRPREQTLETFRWAAKSGEKNTDAVDMPDITLSAIASMTETARTALFGVFEADPTTLALLRPLLLLNALPGREHWEQLLGDTPSADAWEMVARAVGVNFDHQSQEATDCRWLRVLYKIFAGRLHLPSREAVEELVFYPEKGDQRKVRPSIRAMELAFHSASEGSSKWQGHFWEQCRQDTDCIRHELSFAEPQVLGTTLEVVRQVATSLSEHALATSTTTSIDVRHEGAFGLAAYCVCLLEETLRLGNSTSVVGRLALRSIFECYVTLKYLRTRDDIGLWAAYRDYGAGQAKLALLKLEEAETESTGFVNSSFLDAIANEDKSVEFIPINLGHWDTSNLRKISEHSDAKTDYDRYYSWTSAYVHANWAAVRTSVYDVCINPLHRLHRLPRTGSAHLGDVIGDAVILVNKALTLVDELYPPFQVRV
jgi:hypothetical protein